MSALPPMCIGKRRKNPTKLCIFQPGLDLVLTCLALFCLLSSNHDNVGHRTAAPPHLGLFCYMCGRRYCR